MAQLDVIVFDKTGTLTEGGQPRVSDSKLFSSKWTDDTILGIAAGLESASAHPLASAIRQFCETQPSASLTCVVPEETAGRGLKAHFETLHSTAIIGNEAWMEDHGAAIGEDVSCLLKVWKSEAKSVILLAVRDETDIDGGFHITAIFAVVDPLRPEGKGVISSFQDRGIATWMLSGDNIVTAAAVAKAVGIPATNVIAGVLPHEKVCLRNDPPFRL
jgi:P-type Cu+ transporter